jgi:hypothetical protein
MSITLTALQKQRRDTAANWTAENPTLLAGELGYETDTGKWKVGDGSTAWTSLAYARWSQISAYPLVNADIASNAEIAVSKLADGTARQLLQTDAAGTGVEWASNIDVPGTLDVTGAATFDAAVTIQGDLTVNGTTTTIDTQNLIVEDKNVVIGNVTSPTDVTADGGGITLKGTTDKTIQWIDSTDAWTFSEHVNIVSGKEYRINGTKVLDGTSLGSGVISSSLTSVGTIATGTWQGSIIGPTYGGTGVNNGSKTITLGGNLTTSGAFNTTFTATGTTNVTLPTSGTLVNSAVTALSSLGTVGTITSGTWNATTIAVDRGGTGQTTYTNGQLLIGNTTGNTLTKSTLTAGTGITVTNGSGSITIAATGAGLLPTTGGTLTGDLTLNAQSDLRWADADSSNWVAFQGASTIASNITWTLPATDGTSGQVLSTNGTGTLSWATAGTGDVTLTGTQTLTNKTLTDPTIIGTIIEDVFTITDGAAFEIDPGNGSVQLITLGASRTPKATNFVAGESVTLMVDDGTAYTLTWTDTTFGTSGVVWVGGSAPTLATTGYTVIQLWKVSTQVYGARVGNA